MQETPTRNVATKSQGGLPQVRQAGLDVPEFRGIDGPNGGGLFVNLGFQLCQPFLRGCGGVGGELVRLHALLSRKERRRRRRH